ncbi:MAG: hypothetical protein ACI4L7_03615 [Christensenellales bacterium]
MLKTKFKKSKTSFFGRMVGLCFMALCLCAPTFLGLFGREVSASASNITEVTSLIPGSKVYFGEYPQDTVIKVKDGISENGGWEIVNFTWTEGSNNNFSTQISPTEAGVNKNSVKAHNTIKGYIEELLQGIYGSEFNWHTTTVAKFAPNTSCQTENISYDYVTGYYTLLTDVNVSDYSGGENAPVSYPAGSKFYAYNRVVDALNKYYKVSPDTSARWPSISSSFYLTGKRFNYSENSTLETTPITIMSEQSYIKDPSSYKFLKRSYGVYRVANDFYDYYDKYNSRTNKGNVTMHGYDKFLDSGAAVEDYSATGTGPSGIFLFEVKPIEWTVFSADNLQVNSTNSDECITLASSQIIDSNALNYEPWKYIDSPFYYFSSRYDQSNMRAWLNAMGSLTTDEESVNLTMTNGSKSYTDTFYQSKRTFMPMAFGGKTNLLKYFSHISNVTQSRKEARVGLLLSSEIEGNGLQTATQTQYSLACGDQSNTGIWYFSQTDSDGTNLCYGPDEYGRGSVVSGVNVINVFGVRPVICLKKSDFCTSSQFGQIGTNEILNISSPLSLGKEVDASTYSATKPYLLQFATEESGIGTLKTASLEIKQNSLVSTGESYNTTASNFVVTKPNYDPNTNESQPTITAPAVSGFVVAGIKRYDTESGKNISDADCPFTVSFIPITSFLGAGQNPINNTIKSLSGQFVMDYYLIYQGDIYLINPKYVTNPNIYVSESGSASNSGRSAASPVPLAVAEKLAGNGVGVDTGNMSTLIFLENREFSDRELKFKYPVVFNSNTVLGTFITVTSGNVTFENIIFDGKNEERNTAGIVLNDGTTTFNNCKVINFNNTTGDGGGIKVGVEATVSGSLLELSNNKAKTNGGGMYCEGNLNVVKFILTSNMASNGGAIYVTGNVEVGTIEASGNFANKNTSCIYATTTDSSKKFKVTETLDIHDNKANISGGNTYYSSSAVCLEGYKVNIVNPQFNDNENSIASLFLNGCYLMGDGSPTLKGNSNENKGLFSKNYNKDATNNFAGAIYVTDGGKADCSYVFSNISFNNNGADNGYGAVLVVGDYAEKEVTFYNCSFNNNIGVYCGGLAFYQSKDGGLSGNFNITNCTFIGNTATSINEPTDPNIKRNVAGALLVQHRNNTNQVAVNISGTTFLGNQSTKYGVANFELKEDDSITINTVTLGGDLIDGNNKSNISNISTTAGALFAINGSRNSASGVATAFTINEFVAKNNGIVDGSFATEGVLELSNLAPTNEYLLKNCLFEKNESTYSGGAVIIKDCSGKIEDCYFGENSVSITKNENSETYLGGGALYITSQQSGYTCNVDISKTTFAGNSVTLSVTGVCVAGGGAVLANKSLLTLTDVYATGNTVTANGENQMAKGGTICSYGNMQTGVEYITQCQHPTPCVVINGGCYKSNLANFSQNAYSYGGAIWGDCVKIQSGGAIAGITTTIAGKVPEENVTYAYTADSRAQFVSNKAYYGGGVYTSTCLEIDNKDTSNLVALFNGNEATHGGAINAHGVAIIDGGEFTNNIAKNVNDNTASFGNGGAISFENSEQTIKFYNYPTGLSTDSSDASYALPMYAKIVRAEFYGNEAVQGGAIYSNSSLSHNDGTAFAKGSMLEIVGQVDEGSGYSVKIGDISTNPDENKSNSAVYFGGGIYACSPVKLQNINIKYNQANSASAIYLDNQYTRYSVADSGFVVSDKVEISNIMFEGNKSASVGVIQASRNIDITITNCDFIGNENAGAILNFIGANEGNNGNGIGSGTLQNCTFSRNIGCTDTMTIYEGDVINVSNSEVAINDCNFGQNGNNGLAHYGTILLIAEGGVVHLNNISVNGTEGNKIANTDGLIWVQNNGTLKAKGGQISQLTGENGSVTVIEGKASFDEISISNCSVSGNGGAIYVANGGDLYFAGNIDSCSATGNGGAIYVESGGTALIAGKMKLDLTYSQCNITNCSAQNGGGIFADGDVVVQRATISGNSATNSGGGIYANNNSSLTIGIDSDITNNKITGSGRGAGIYSKGQLYITDATISGNSFDSATNTYGGGLYAENVSFEIVNTIFQGNNAESGGAIFASGGAVDLQYCNFLGEAKNNTVKLSNCYANLYECLFENISSTEKASALLLDGGSCIMQNCTFNNNIFVNDTSTDKKGTVNSTGVLLEMAGCEFTDNGTNGLLSNVYYNNTDGSARLVYCSFTNGKANGSENSVTISTPNAWVENCTFDNNQEGGLLLQVSYGVVANCNFTANAKNGGLKIVEPSSANANVEILDCSFLKGGSDKVNSSDSNGGAVFIGAGCNVRISGTFEARENSSTNGGAVYVSSGAKLYITRNSKVIISDNKSSDNDSNLLLAGDNLLVIEGGLLDGSSIGISLASGNIVARNGGIPLESADVNKLFSDSKAHILCYSYNDKIVYKKAITTETTDFYYEATIDGINYYTPKSDIVLAYSQMPKEGFTLDKSYFKAYVGIGDQLKEVSIEEISFQIKSGELYGEEESGKIKITQKGSQTIKFLIKKVKNGENEIIFGEEFGGDVVVDVVGEYLYIISTPQAIMTAKKINTFRLTQAGSVIGSNGQEIAGTWSLVSGENTEKSGYYRCQFTPKQSALYENASNLISTMYVNVVYDKLYYFNSTNSGFFADSAGSVQLDGVGNISDALPLLNDNGTIVFMDTYIVNTSENIVATKRVNFVRQKTDKDFAMIEISAEKSLYITGQNAEIIFDGNETNSVNFPAFVVNGTLTLGNNVTVRNFEFTSNTSSSNFGAICNFGTLILQGCKIYNNKALSSSNNQGGAIYNEGTMNIVAGNFYNNTAEGSGKGGFVYSKGKLTVSGGRIYNNTSAFGAGIYVANGGSASLVDGYITHNYATSNGGGVYVENGGKLSLSSTQILSNKSGADGAGVYKAEGGIVLLSSGEEIAGSTIQSIEVKNIPFATNNQSNDAIWVVILGAVAMILATAIMFILLKKSQKVCLYKIK